MELCYVCKEPTERSCVLCHKPVCGVHSKQKYLKGTYTSTVCDQCVPKANMYIKIAIATGLLILIVLIIYTASVMG